MIDADGNDYLDLKEFSKVSIFFVNVRITVMGI